ncbi:hypothetical protein [Yoonia sp.]|jgi:hypothetical protein|uniref:hypothetical protein n=1 Tax=Yoonia sp. TaxID=2212373 RepID=UPI0025FA205E|nr:hypothetical protein [Yoonia sp.]
MKFMIWTAGIVAAFALTACAQDGRYPLSGEACAPTDPVLSLDASNYMVVPMIR